MYLYTIRQVESKRQLYIIWAAGHCKKKKQAWDCLLKGEYFYESFFFIVVTSMTNGSVHYQAAYTQSSDSVFEVSDRN